MKMNRFFAGAAFVLAIALVVGFLPACDEEKKPADQGEPAKELPGGAPADAALTDADSCGDACGGCPKDAAADAMVPASAEGCGGACADAEKAGCGGACADAEEAGCGGCAEKKADGCGGCADAEKKACGKDCADCPGDCETKKVGPCADCPGGCTEEQMKKCAEKGECCGTCQEEEKKDCCGTCGGDS
ncbi:MAG: hypothetical protein ABFS86_19620 [Planctomycetota bacterium]